MDEKEIKFADANMEAKFQEWLKSHMMVEMLNKMEIVLFRNCYCVAYVDGMKSVVEGMADKTT